MCDGTIQPLRVTIGFFVALLFGSMLCAESLPAQAYIGDAAGVVDEERADGSVDLYAYNELPIPIYVYIAEERLQNYRSTPPLPQAIAIPPQASNYKVLSFEVIDSSKSRSVRYSYRFSFSDPTQPVHPDTDYLYLFPYAHGAKFEVGQTHGGTKSHSNDANRYAIDFGTPAGTPVHAARDGVVVFVKEDSNRGGLGVRYQDDANMIIVMHIDNTFAYYLHLQQNGSLVGAGERVTTGQHIGISGDTGRSSGAHLHFDVHVPTEDGLSKSIPVTFVSVNNEPIPKPQQGFYYYSAHPGKRPFEVALGRSITAESFDGYIKSIAGAGKIDIRTERIDNTTLVFCLNGTTDDIDARIDFQTTGFTSEIVYPLHTIIPAKSEVFCGIFHIIPDARKTVIAPSIRY